MHFIEGCVTPTSFLKIIESNKYYYAPREQKASQHFSKLFDFEAMFSLGNILTSLGIQYNKQHIGKWCLNLMIESFFSNSS